MVRQNPGREPARMTPLLEAARDLQAFLIERQWKFCIIGGLALLRWGEPRFTRDVDVTLLSGFGREDEFIAPLLEGGYRGRVTDAAGFARRNRVLLLTTPGGTPVDIALGGSPFEAEMVERSTLFEFARGCQLRTCSAEDLVILKRFAFRPRGRARCRNRGGAAARCARLGVYGAASETTFGSEHAAGDLWKRSLDCASAIRAYRRPRLPAVVDLLA